MKVAANLPARLSERWLVGPSMPPAGETQHRLTQNPASTNATAPHTEEKAGDSLNMTGQGGTELDAPAEWSVVRPRVRVLSHPPVPMCTLGCREAGRNSCSGLTEQLLPCKP
ncbi:hypothetical protein KIL84_015312 [Mauremys mutica]|uniref:Uncharacterized protein n=1 Tax=Mauremys mutica TaxID=74926 RepID=A0A9D4ARW8_9SAUR|nr:hypothetical protein KIL84_015312 [Mauremys mutica]